MRFAVFGTGGVGGYFGGRLAQAGEETTFIARGAHLEAIRRDGLRVDSIQGDFLIRPARAESDPAAVGVVDAVIIGVKAWQVPEAALAIRPLVGPETLVLPLQNGVDAPGQLAARLDEPGAGKPHVLGGLCRISCVVAGPGWIRHVGIVPCVAFNRLDGKPDERVEHLRLAFEKTGAKVEVPTDIQAALWHKFAFIASFGGVGAVTRSPVGALRAIPETRRLLEAALREVEAVGRASGVALSADVFKNTLATIDALPEGTMASMQRDIIEGRPSELEAQVGTLVRLGRAHAAATPVFDFIYASLLPQEARARQA